MEKNSPLIRFALPAILLLGGLLIYQYGYQRVRTDIVSLKEQQDIRTRTLQKYLKLIEEKPRFDKRLATLKEARKAAGSNLIEGQTPSIAAAALQDMVKSFIIGKGGTISSERVGKPEDLGKFKIITISIDASIPDTRSLGDVLYSIETRSPYLVVKELDARVKNYREPKELSIKLDVAALVGGK